MPLKIIADENIPHVQHYFGNHAELVRKPGRNIAHQDLLDADVLLVRSVTPVNAALLQNTNVKFVGSTTIGFDHLDIQWLDKANIAWAIAKGCNAVAVTEYVVSVIAKLQNQGLLSKPNLRAGIIGIGTIGSQVVEKLHSLGFNTLQYDPLRAITDKNFHSTLLDDFAELDFITLHTPLTTTGSFPTQHLINKHFLQRQKQDCILLNTSRGAVIDFSALKQYGRHLYWCLDVWENEPVIDPMVLENALIATPHIAGYSIQSKYRGIEMIYRKALEKNILTTKVSSLPFPTQSLSLGSSTRWQDVVLNVFDPAKTTIEMKQACMQNPAAFDILRKNFSERFEFQFLKLEKNNLSDAERDTLKKLGFS